MKRHKTVPAYLDDPRCLCGHSGKHTLRWEARPGLVLDLPVCWEHRTFATWTDPMKKEVATKVVFRLLGDLWT
jgi:hypothetical protein